LRGKISVAGFAGESGWWLDREGDGADDFWVGYRTFSGGRAVDSVDTEKSRIVMHELEPGWWVLAVGCLLALYRLGIC
jgi:hypothetical protein